MSASPSQNKICGKEGKEMWRQAKDHRPIVSPKSLAIDRSIFLPVSCQKGNCPDWTSIPEGEGPVNSQWAWSGQCDSGKHLPAIWVSRSAENVNCNMATASWPTSHLHIEAL